MNRWSVRCCVAALLAAIAAGPSWSQRSGTTGASQPGSPIGAAGPGSASQPPNSQPLAPIYINGRVLMESGQPVAEPVSVGLVCRMREIQVIRTDSKGYFHFTLGQGAQGNMDLSASNDDPVASSIGGPSTLGSFGHTDSSLLGCELRVSVAGYEPASKLISEPGDLGGIDAGTLLLRRLAGATGSTISVTSMLIPEKARKEFDKGDKDVRGNHVDSGIQHLEKAVAEYDKYAAAWSELGAVYSATRQTEKASQAFEKAIAADPHYVPPYVGLAALQLQTEQYENAAGTAGKALELDPNAGMASYIQAGADLKLDRLDEAEKNALVAERQPHQNIPQLHALLAEIFLRKNDYANAAAQMRAYLREAPQGKLAGAMKENLPKIEEAAGSQSGGSGDSASKAQVVP